MSFVWHHGVLDIQDYVLGLSWKLKLDILISGRYSQALGYPMTNSNFFDLPYLADGLLVCPGGWVGSREWHRCSWVVVDGEWCFHSPFVVADQFEQFDKRFAHSTTILDVPLGTTVRCVRCRSRGGYHVAESVVEMCWDDGNLVMGKVITSHGHDLDNIYPAERTRSTYEYE